MKKTITLMLILTLLLTSSAVAFAEEEKKTDDSTIALDGGPVTYVDAEGSEEVTKLIENISDKEIQLRVARLLCTPAYTIFYSQGNTEGDCAPTTKADTEKYYEKLAQCIKKLSKMSENQLDELFLKDCTSMIDKNKNNNNILWEETFINGYVAKYLPTAKNQLLTQNKINSESIEKKYNELLNTKAAGFTYTWPFKKICVAPYQVLQTNIGEVASKVLTYYYADRGVQGMAPSTTVTAYGPGYAKSGSSLVSNDSYSARQKVAIVDKKATFRPKNQFPYTSFFTGIAHLKVRIDWYKSFTTL